MHRILRGGPAMVAAAMLAITAGGLPASAATLKVTFRATKCNCLDGTASVAFQLQVQDPSHAVLDTVDPVVPDVDGAWHACLAIDGVAPGMRLRATSSATSNTVLFTIPTRAVPLDSSGHYTKEMTSAFDARGFDEARVTDTNAAGNSYTVTSVFPWLAVAPVDRFVFGESRAGHKVTFKLSRTPGGPRLETRVRTPQFADYAFHLPKDTSTGRQVTADFASDAKLTIPSTKLTFDVHGSATTLHLRCLPGRKMMVDLDPGPDTVVTADSHGKADLNLSTSDFDPATVGVVLTCQSSAGDVITRRFEAPLD